MKNIVYKGSEKCPVCGNRKFREEKQKFGWIVRTCRRRHYTEFLDWWGLKKRLAVYTAEQRKMEDRRLLDRALNEQSFLGRKRSAW